MVDDMKDKNKKELMHLISPQSIENRILLIRGRNVMIDQDLALLYGVNTGQLTRQVRRNIERFPDDFMFQLDVSEYESLKCQFGISKKGRGGRRYNPYAFTQEGVAMLSTVLSSERAILVSIQIMRAFIKLRQMLSTHVELRKKIESMEKKYDAQFKAVFTVIKELLEPVKKFSGLSLVLSKCGILRGGF
jgi:hypothetical protein